MAILLGRLEMDIDECVAHHICFTRHGSGKPLELHPLHRLSSTRSRLALEEFVDGAMGANNPVQELWNEVSLL